MKYISTEKIESILTKVNNGEKIKRSWRFCHQGNFNIINTKLPYLYTKDELIEYAKCYNSPIYFIEKYCKIFNPNLGKENIKLREYQKNWIDSLLNYRYNSLYEVRQSGFDTIMLLFSLWLITFRDEKILYNTYYKTNIIDRLKITYVCLHHFLKANIKFISKNKIETQSGGKILIKPIIKKEDLFDIDQCIVSSVKGFGKIDKILFDIFPHISEKPTTKLVILSNMNFKENSVFNILQKPTI